MAAKTSSKIQQYWYTQGWQKGVVFARKEADYDELAAVSKAGSIPVHWDLYRAQILQQYMHEKGFDFTSYSKGFANACAEFYKSI